MDRQINSVWHREVRIPWIRACVYVPRGTTYTLCLCLYIESKSTRRGSGGRGGFGPDPLHLAFLAHHENFMLFSSSVSCGLCSSQARADQQPPGQAGSEPRLPASSLLLLLQLLMSRQSTALFLRSLSRDCWEGPGLGIMCKLAEKTPRTYLKCFFSFTTKISFQIIVIFKLSP